MISIAQATEDLIRNSPFLEEVIRENIANLSEIARRIKPEIEERTMKDVTLSSVVMALKRLTVREDVHSHRLRRSFRVPPELIVRSDLFEITVENSPTLIEKQQKLLGKASRGHSNFATITHGVFETTIIGNRSVREYVLNLYEQERIISRIDKLSSITIKFPSDIVEQPGVYYSVLKTLAWAGLSIAEVVSTYSELTVVLPEQDVDRAFALIKKLFTTR